MNDTFDFIIIGAGCAGCAGSVVAARLAENPNFKIVDASVYPPPYLHGYNPTRGIYVLTEVISDVIKDR